MLVAATVSAFEARAQDLLGLGAGAQYDLVHYRATDRGVSEGRRPWIPPDLTGWGWHGTLSYWTGTGELAMRAGVVLQFQHTLADYSFVVKPTTGSAEPGSYWGDMKSVSHCGSSRLWPR